MTTKRNTSQISNRKSRLTKSAPRQRKAILPTMFLGAALTMLPIATSFAQYPYESKVDLRFDHYYSYEEMTDALKQLVNAYPEFLSMQSLGQSIGGKEMWLVTMNNPETGPDSEKEAMFIDANIHGNEIQGAEVILYSIWYLTKSYGKIDKLTKIMDERAFYFLPMENPDGRTIWIEGPATPHYQRGGIKPTDNDHDGLYDEDGYDDLDGDGNITTMWIRDPLGRWKRDPKDDRFFIRVDPDEEPGGWSRLGSEGIDNDGDGSINEDGIGGYDPNRNWPSDWQPNHVQYGADDYPFSLPETRAIGEFIKTKPNIAAYQSYHNSGGMILRGPGAAYISYPYEDVRFYNLLGETGEKLLPYYRYMVIYKDLYTVHGGEVNWAAEGLGIASFTNELWTDMKMYQKPDQPSREQEREFQDLLQFGDIFVPYKEFDHPQYGKVLIGGTKKYSSRVTPPWMLEEQCHRNFSFTMYHADEMPQVSWGLNQVRSLGNNIWEITVEIKNDKIIPTITAHARNNHIGERDYLDCATGDRAQVVASGYVSSFLPNATLDNPTEHDPERIWNDGGIGSRDNRLFRFLVSGTGSVDLHYFSRKGGTIDQSIELRETLIEMGKDE